MTRRERRAARIAREREEKRQRVMEFVKSPACAVGVCVPLITAMFVVAAVISP